jgi:hypothetical protein
MVIAQVIMGNLTVYSVRNAFDGMERSTIEDIPYRIFRLASDDDIDVGGLLK